MPRAAISLGEVTVVVSSWSESQLSSASWPVSFLLGEALCLALGCVEVSGRRYWEPSRA